MPLWIPLLALACLSAALLAVIRDRGIRRLLAAIGIMLGLATVAAWLVQPDDGPDPMTATDDPSGSAGAPPEPTLPVALPPQVTDDEFVSSRACLECHAEQHASWHQSYHRRMTQIVTPETMAAPSDEVILPTGGLPYRFWREGDEFWVEMVDPHWEFMMQQRGAVYEGERAQHIVRRRIVMSTGSHHYQAYWVNNGRGNELVRFPWIYHIGAERWLTSDAAFVAPPDQPSQLALWNDNCIQCHTVHGQPGPDYDQKAYVSQVAELGIACEACHGPGREHVAFQRDQAAAPTVARSEPDTTIVNPARLSHERSSQVCGQCHSFFAFESEEFLEDGFTYRAGDDLFATRKVHEFFGEYVQSRPDLQVGHWQDGTSRLGGREFTAMRDSKCYTDGQLSCLSCHSLHDYQQTNDQLAAQMDGNEACLQCHESLRESLVEHTHHAADSEGSKCYNCHMPHTSFALLKSIRSHRVDSPSATMTSEYDRPNACNLCHLDRTLEWTADKLTEWYGQPPLQVGPVAKETSATLLYAITGDAVHRAMMAWHMGWQPAQEASGTNWQVPFLAMLLKDPYAAVRFVAHQSLRTYPGFEDVAYDCIGAKSDRAAASKQVLDAWYASQDPAATWPAELLISPDGKLRQQRIEEFLRYRDNRPINLPE